MVIALPWALLDKTWNACDGAAGADASDENIDLALRCLPQISGPVVFMDRRLAGFLNYLQQDVAIRIAGANFSALAIAPFMPLAPSVNTNLAPKATSNLRRSTLMVSGMVNVGGMPFAAATNAKAIPVLPLVGSINSLPGPTSRALQHPTIAAPIRHLTSE